MNSLAYFQRVAGDWDAMRAEFFPERLRDEALRAAGVFAGARAADVGAGTGFVTEALLAAGCEVLAVDQSQAMLERLAAKFGPEARLRTLAGADGALPLAPGTLDFVFANMYLHHVEDPAAAIAEMARALAPGGALVVTDLDEHRFEFLRVEQHDRWMGFDRRDVERWFRAAGLVDVGVGCAGADCCSDSCSGQAPASISIFLAKGRKARG